MNNEKQWRAYWHSSPGEFGTDPYDGGEIYASILTCYGHTDLVTWKKTPDLYISIERGIVIVEDQGYWEPPAYEMMPYETIKVRPVYQCWGKGI